MSIVFILLGSVLLQAGARAHLSSGGNQPLGSGLTTLAMQLGGVGLIIFGLINLFS